MGGGGGVVNAIVDPIGSAVGAITGDKVNLNPLTIGKDQLYDKPKEMQKNIENEIKQQEEAARRAEEEYQKEKTDEKKRLRDIALQNLQRSQAQLKSQGPTKKGGYSGTVLTSPLGVAGDTSASTGQKTLLGY